MTKLKIPETFEHKNNVTVTVPISIEKYQAFLCVDQIVFISFETNKSLKICFSKFGNYSWERKRGNQSSEELYFSIYWANNYNDDNFTSVIRSWESIL